MLTKEEFRALYAQYRSSGLSVREFCMNEGLGEAKFYYWQKKMDKAHPTGFVPIVIEKENHYSSRPSLLPNVFPSGCSLEINYPDGKSVKLSGSVDYELVRSLLLLNTH